MEIINLITDLFKYNTGYLVKHLSAMDKTLLFVRPDNKSNPIIWILGHIVASRGSLIEMLGEEPQIRELGYYFNAGSKPLSNPSGYPNIDEIMGQLGKLSTKLTRLIKDGGEALLNRQVWGQYDSIGKHIVSGYIHEAYHVGQISYLMNLVSKSNSAGYRFKLAGKKVNSPGKILIDSLKAALTVK
ncbi:MAG: DinB family protein [candidate division Zixibacteria bacterium]|nr:DinB family protein [candidate division Zixibacteria bacterium]